LLTPVGNGTEETFEALINGKNGVGYITYFDTSDCSVKIDAEIKDFNKEEYVDKKDLKIFDKFVIYAIAAAEMAKDMLILMLPLLILKEQELLLAQVLVDLLP